MIEHDWFVVSFTCSDMDGGAFLWKCERCGSTTTTAAKHKARPVNMKDCKFQSDPIRDMRSHSNFQSEAETEETSIAEILAAESSEAEHAINAHAQMMDGYMAEHRARRRARELGNNLKWKLARVTFKGTNGKLKNLILLIHIGFAHVVVMEEYSEME